MNTLTLVVPMPPNLANRPMHHMVKHTVKCGYWALLDAMFNLGYDWNALNRLQGIENRTKIAALRTQIAHARDFAHTYISSFDPASSRPTLPAARWSHARIRSVMHLGAAMDAGNAVNRHKWVEDYLVTRAVLLNDSQKHLEWESLPEQIVKRDGNYRIELTITPLAEASVKHLRISDTVAS